MSNEQVQDQVTIDGIGRECDARFSSITAKLSTAANADNSSSKPSSLRSADEYSRFKLWAGNIGALQSGNRKTSLRYRLRKVPRVVKYISDLLKDMRRLLNDLDFIIEDWVSNRATIDEPSQTQENTSDLESGVFNREGEDVSEAGMIIAAIGATITNLFRLSGLIREAVPHDRFEKAVERSATREDAFQSTPDVNHVQDKFPRLRDQSVGWFRDRLARAITHRREYLRYCSEHQDHLKSLDPPDPIEGTTVYGGASASSVLPNELGQLDLDGSRSSSSDVSSLDSGSTTSVGDDYVDLLKLPALSEVSGGANEFECPFCHIVLHNIDNQSLWKKHAFKDLRPYVCTFRGCSHIGLFSSRTEWFNHELEFHRSRWCCPFCSHGSMSTIARFHEHVRIQHMQQLTESQLETLTSLSRQSPRKFKCSACQFCSNWETKLRISGSQTVSLSRLRKHIGGHLEQLAFSVIRGLEFNQDPQGRASSGTGEVSEDNEWLSLDSDPIPRLRIVASTGWYNAPSIEVAKLPFNEDLKSQSPRPYAISKNPVENMPKYQQGNKAYLVLGRRGSFVVEIMEVRKHNGWYQYKVEQNGVPYNSGEWVDQERLREVQ